MSIPTLHVGQGAVVDALTVFPVWSSTAPAPRRYLTAKNADLTIAERDGAPVVGELVVTNNSDAPVLLLAGDLLEGGWQHRTVSESILIDAGMAAVVEVTCVERGRWSGGRRHDNRGRKLSPSVRAAVVSIPRPTRQSGVWDRVSSYDRRFTASATESYVDHLDNTTTAATTDLDELRPLPGQVGVLIGIAGYPVFLELFDSPEALDANWLQILKSASLDAVGAPSIATPGRRARRFVQRLTHTSIKAEPSYRARTEPGRHQRCRLGHRHRVGRRTHAPARDEPQAPTPGPHVNPQNSTRLTSAQTDRAAGVLLATACGDALGAGYEFGPPLPPDTPVGMVGGGTFGWAPGEWTDDTSMAIAIAEVAATGADLQSTEALDAIAARWVEWAGEATDVGAQTRAVLRAAGPQPHRCRPHRGCDSPPPEHRKVRRQRRADAHRTRRTGLPPRPRRSDRRRTLHRRAHASRPGGG